MSHSRFVALPLLIFSLLILTCASWAQVDFSAGILDAQAVTKTAETVTSEMYPDAETVLLDAVLRVDYNADGTYEQWNEEFVKMLTEEGRRQYQTIASYFTIPYQRGPEDCRIDLIEIIKPDGTVLPIDVEAQSKVMINPGSMAQNIYNPNDKLIQVNVAGLEVNDVIHYVMFDRIVQPRMTNTWYDWSVFESTRPMIHSALEVHAPADVPLQKIALKSAIEGTVASTVVEKGDKIVYRWDARDVPRMFPEPNMPPLHSVVQRLLISTAPDWETVSTWYWNLSEPHLEAITPEMQEKVDELIAGIDDPLEQVKAVFQFVSKEIRYMGIVAESTAPGYEPHDVKDTFEARHGVCRDKAALLVAMLQQAGFEAYPTLIHNGPKKDSEVPQPYFNHAIVAVRMDDTYQLMDPTDENTTELLPAYLNDKSYLVATPEGDTLRTSAISPADQNLMHIHTTGSVDESGALVGETVLKFDGINDNAYRGWFARVKPEDRDRFFDGLMKRASSGARVTSILYHPTDMTDISTTLTVRITFEVDDVLIQGHDLAMFPLPLLGTRIGMVNFIIGQTGLKERKYPLLTEMACGVVEEIQLELAPAFTNIMALPVCEPVDTPQISWSLNVSQTGTMLYASDSFRLQVVEFSPDEYQVLKSTLKKTEVDLRKMPIYRLSSVALDKADDGEEPDAIILRQETLYELTDPHSWKVIQSVRKKVQTYAGKKDNAELKISFNTGWEDVELIHALVISPEGKTNVISDKEINVMDAPWVGGARRYPPTKTLVAGLPAVEIGSIIDYSYIRWVKDSPFFALRQSFRSFDEIKATTIKATVPTNMVLHKQLLDPDGVVATGDSLDALRQVYEWSAAEVSPVKKEDMLPPWWRFNPTILLSAGEWPAYADMLHTRLLDAATEQFEAEQKARELVQDVNDPWDRVQAIRDYVAIHIRRAGPPLTTMPLSAISAADTTLQDAYGNTTDRAILLYVMLRAIGYHPTFVLASGVPNVAELASPLLATPDARMFSAVLVSVQDEVLNLEPGTSIYLNDTDQYAALGSTPHENLLGLILPSGESITITPARSAYSEVHYAIRITDDGTATIARQTQLWGNGFGDEKKRYAEMTPEERRRFFQEMIVGISQSAVADSELVTNFEDYPGTIAFTVDVADYAVSDGDFLYFNVPASLANLFRLRSDTRINPLYLSRRQTFKITMDIQIPQAYTPVYLPSSIVRKQMGHVNMHIEYSAHLEEYEGEKHIVVEGIVNMAPGIIPAADYQKLLTLDQELSHKRERTILLRKE